MVNYGGVFYMFSNENIANFLENSHTISNFNIILTNLNNIIFSSPKYYSEKYINKQISDDLKKYIYSINCSNYQDSILLINDSKNTKPIYHLDTQKYYSQIILPILCENNVYGVLIFYSYNNNFNCDDLKFAKTTKYFVEKFIVKLKSNNI